MDHSSQAVECVQFIAPDAAHALLRAENLVPENTSVFLFEDERSLGTLQWSSQGFWALSETKA
jgi:hypothetical protein